MTTTHKPTPAVPDDFAKCVKCIHRFTCCIMPSTCKGAETRPVERNL